MFEFVNLIFTEVTGTIASVVGAVLTVFYSRRAKGSADNAQIAATEARNQISSVSVLSELNASLVQIDDLSRQIGSSSWELVEERATSLRNRVVPIVRQKSELFTIDTRKDLVQLVSHMREIGEEADLVRFTNRKAPSQAKLLKIVRDQKEVLIVAISEMKERLSKNE
ncbi:hypothetical protein [Loktanella sp. Alg231-35]|uniref:hypothetical protein n=1 Tax=Loktanella sp. Alg231-35 TaxID=1922220 RepID=UPI00131EFCE6|nr:hypothetical protein [Loktanella sp. Alg231-35]